MAKVITPDGSKRRGKLDCKSNEVHRVKNGREQSYIFHPSDNPPSKAQKLHRSTFGKTNAIVNSIMADPKQEAEWRQRMEQYNQSINPMQPPYPKRYITVRQYAYAVISQQLKQKPSAKRRKAKLPLSLPRGIRLQVKPFSDLTATEIYEILKARFTVFVGEQHIHYLDEDNIDYRATHYTVRKKGLVLAYARVFADDDKNTWRIGRMLTIERGKGYAKYLMQQIAADARDKGITTLRLHAQAQAVPFYEHLGFHAVGNFFTEAELPHIRMEMNL